MEQLNIFEMLYSKFKIDKPVRMIELFAGYGSQSLAMKYLGVDFEHWKICEWAVPSIQAYKDAHFTNNNEDYSKYFTKEHIIDVLYNRGISMDYNEPMKLEQIKRMSENQLRTIYNNIAVTHNLVNIQKTKGRDLEIIEQDKYTNCYFAEIEEYDHDYEDYRTIHYVLEKDEYELLEELMKDAKD